MAQGDTCASITTDTGIGLTLFSRVNPSVDTAANCTGSLIVGDAYCVSAVRYEDAEAAYTWESLACWSSADASAPVLAGGGNYTDVDGMTVSQCATSCFSTGHAYFSLGGSDVCSCGYKMSDSAQ
jgi:hypothetical protein